MDLAKLQFKDSPAATLELLHPVDGTTLRNDEGKASIIQLHGADSDPFRKAMRNFGNKKINQKGKSKTSIEEIEETSAKILAKATAGWSNITHDGKDLEFSIDKAEWLYTEYPWIREQVDEFVNERAHFLKDA